MAKSYDERKAQVAEIRREQSTTGRDIAPIPKPKKPKRRESCRLNFRLFCETYYSEVFNLEWSTDHLTVIAKVEESVLQGGLFALAMPRGSGKTALSTAAAEWALLYGHRSFVVLIGATAKHAENLLSNIRADFETNDLLYEDFPEAIYPIRRIGRIAQRAKGQLLNGKPTMISITSKEIVLPTVPKACSSGGRIEVTGITGSFRGMQAKRGAATIRPDFVLIDDPQDDESARSPVQVRERLSVIMGAILGLAGPKKKIAGVMPVTVIAKDDVADQVLDRKLRPEWQGQRTKLLRTMPTDTKLWEAYAEHRAKGLQEERGLADATAFYEANRVAMDAGAEASWPARFNPDEVSAIQYAMNLKLTDERAFFAEYQNEPLSLIEETPLVLNAQNVVDKVKNCPRGKVPVGVEKLTAFVDVQGTVLYYNVCAFEGDFTGHVIDYGTFPEQGKSYFFLREVSKPIKLLAPNAPWEAQLYKALEGVTHFLLGKEWEREAGGGGLKISRIMIDANWGNSTSIVKQFCRQSPYSALLLPSHGKGITADRLPLNEYKPQAGVRMGWNWRLTNAADRHIIYDTNAWKTFVACRILDAVGSRGELSLFHGSPTLHKMFVDHATAEYPTPTEGMGRTVNVWKARPNRENHWWDCLVGAYVAASEQGILGAGHDAAKGAGAKQRRKLDVKF